MRYRHPYRSSCCKAHDWMRALVFGGAVGGGPRPARSRCVPVRALVSPLVVRAMCLDCILIKGGDTRVY